MPEPASQTISIEAAKIDAAKPAQDRTDLPDNDALTLIVADQRLQQWTAVSVHLGMEAVPPVAELRLSFATSEDDAEIKIEPFKTCELYIGRSKLITGYIQRVSYSVTQRSHEIAVQVGGKTQDLVECAAILAGGHQLVNHASLHTIAKELSTPFGVDVVLEGEDSVVGANFVVSLTERPWDVMDSVARYAQRIPYEDNEGRLVLAKVGTAKMGSGITQAANVERAHVVLDGTIRYSDYIAALASVDNLAEVGPSGSLLRGDFRDEKVPRFRPLVVVSPQINTQGQIAVQMAQYEAARRIGRSQVIEVTVSDWRDAKGKLWTINTLVDVHIPSINVKNRQWLIASVTFSRSLAGQHATLVIMPPSAFTIAPSTLGAVGADIKLDPPVDPQTGANPTPQPPRPVADNNGSTTVRYDNASGASTAGTSNGNSSVRVNLPGIGG